MAPLFEGISDMKGKALLGYTLYGIIVTVFFLYLLLPSAILERSIESFAAEQYGIVVHASAAGLTVPPGMRMERCRVSLPGRPDIMIVVQDVVVRAKLGRLLGGRLSALFHCRTYGGTLEGSAALNRRFTLTGPMDARVSASGVDLAQATWLVKLLERRVEGTLKGVVEVERITPVLTEGEGKLDMVLERGSIYMLEPFMGFERLDYDKIEIKADLVESDLTVRNITLEGPDIMGTFNGKISLHSHIPSSRMAFKGSVSLPAMGVSLPLTVGGTLADPRVRVGRS